MMMVVPLLCQTITTLRTIPTRLAMPFPFFDCPELLFLFFWLSIPFLLFFLLHTNEPILFFFVRVLSLFFPLRESMDMKNLCVQKISDNQHVEISPVA